MEEKVMRSCCVLCFGKRLLFPKITQFETSKKRRGILGPFFPLVLEDQVIIDYLRRQKLDQARLSFIQADVLGQRPFGCFQKWSFLVGKPHGCWGNPAFLETSMFFFVLKMVHAWCYELCYSGFHRTWHQPHILKGCCVFFGHPGENETTLSLQSCPTPFLNLAVSPALKIAWFILAWLEVRLGLATSL